MAQAERNRFMLQKLMVGPRVPGGALSRFARLMLLLLVAPALHAGEATAFPGATGWASATPGGRDGEILRVTSLAPDGPGSLRAALEHEGPRSSVLGGVGTIALQRATVRMAEPFVTIAGQTAPSAGSTIIRGGVDVATPDVAVRHIRIRPGEAGAAKGSDWGEDG